MSYVSTQGGFTIIETMLFLVITAGMVITAMSVVAGRTQEVQFTDGIRSIQSFVERRISNTSSGSIIDATQECSKTPLAGYNTSSSDGSCIFLGYMFWFGDEEATVDEPQQSQIHVYQIFGERFSTSDLAICTGGGDTALRCVEPEAIPSTPVERFDIPWSLEMTQMQNDSADNVRMVGFFRNPNGSTLVPVAVAKDQEHRLSEDTTYSPNTVTAHSWYGSEVSAKACFTDGKRQASVSIGNAERQFSVETQFNDPECPAV